MALRRLLILLLVGVLATLTSLAHASPPDQTWIAGLYDNADYDDIVLCITSAVGAMESRVDCDPGPVRLVVAFVPQIDERLLPSLPLSSHPSRAPPA